MDIFWQPGMTLEDSEKAIILYELRRLSGNKTRTAQSLGIAIRTLDNKLDKYAGRPPQPDIAAPQEVTLVQPKENVASVKQQIPKKKAKAVAHA